VKLTTVSPEMLPHAWPIVEPWISEACRRGTGDQTPADLLLLCRSGAGALMLIGEPGQPPVAAGVTQVRDHEDGTRSAWILALGGSQARAWLDTLNIIEAGARRIGCASIHFVGRAGWQHLLPAYDCHVSYSKRLD
jgi:hypothetical protein